MTLSYLQLSLQQLQSFNFSFSNWKFTECIYNELALHSLIGEYEMSLRLQVLKLQRQGLQLLLNGVKKRQLRRHLRRRLRRRRQQQQQQQQQQLPAQNPLQF